MDLQAQGPRTPSALWMTIQGRGQHIAQQEGWEHAFRIPDYAYDIYQGLCWYFCGDETGMHHYHLSPRKGLLVFGGVGVGKTLMMRLFARNIVQGYHVVRCAKIEGEYGQKDAAGSTIDKYSQMRPNAYLSEYYQQSQLGYCFDDLGAEDIGSNYGKKDFMIDILENRYERTDCKGPRTHITTNLSLDQIAARYGPRVLDRMRQMFNLIEFPQDIPSQRQ